MDLNADNRSTPFRGNVHLSGWIGSGDGGPGGVAQILMVDRDVETSCQDSGPVCDGHETIFTDVSLHNWRLTGALKMQMIRSHLSP